MTDHQQGPDQTMLESLRSTKAQEAYLGKETILDLGFESGRSVFSSRRPAAAVTVSSASSDRRRRKKKESGQNWLAGSLSLPSLGQSSSNAAASALSAGAPDSEWGWLADEVSGQPNDIPALTEDFLTEEELSLGFSPEEARSADPSNPYSTKYTESSSSFRDDDARGMAGHFSNDERTGADAADPSLDQTRDAAPEWGSTRLAGSALKDYSAPSGMAGMSQTRAVISDWSAGVRSDFSSLPTVGSRGTPAGMRDRSSSLGSPGVLDAGSPSIWRGSSAMGASSAGFSSSTRTPSWKGGWSANSAGASRPSQFQTVSEPIPNLVIPASSSERFKPSTSSGGYKPAWY